jgi:ketosteroid isomerase-like protein
MEELMSVELSRAQLKKWLDDYKAAWENRDAEAAGRLFTTDARYFETPFALPFLGSAGVRDYWQAVTEEQRDIHFAYQIISITDASAVVHWTSRFIWSSEPVELDGMLLLDFDRTGLCSVLREWWLKRELPVAA